ncbi:hypothetical protein ABG768_003105, partial [Culter alburnus]
QSKEILLARRLALRTPGELCGFSGASKKKSIQLLLENTKPAIILTVTESSQRGPKVVRVVLDEFKSHLEVRGTAGAPPSHPHPRVPRFPDTAGGFLQVPPPPSPRDRAAPVERCDTCQSSRRHGIAMDGSREKQREPSRSNGGRQMARRLRLVPWKLSKSEQIIERPSFPKYFSR